MCVSSREGGDVFPVTDDKTGTADLSVATESDVRTIFTSTWKTPDVVATMTLVWWSNGATEAECACLSRRVLAETSLNRCLQDSEHESMTTLCSSEPV